MMDDQNGQAPATPADDQQGVPTAMPAPEEKAPVEEQEKTSGDEQAVA